jgi:hypothetical protein
MGETFATRLTGITMSPSSTSHIVMIIRRLSVQTPEHPKAPRVRPACTSSRVETLPFSANGSKKWAISAVPLSNPRTVRNIETSMSSLDGIRHISLPRRVSFNASESSCFPSSLFFLPNR